MHVHFYALVKPKAGGYCKNLPSDSLECYKYKNV